MEKDLPAAFIRIPGCGIIPGIIPGITGIIWGGNVWGNSTPFNFPVINLQAIENSLTSIWPSPLTSANPL